MTKHMIVTESGELAQETRCSMKLCLIDGNTLVFYGSGCRLCILVATEDVPSFEVGKDYSIVIPHE